MNRKIVNGIVILIVIILVGAVFIAKQAGTGNVSSMQSSIDSNATREQSDRTPLEIAEFSPDLSQKNEKPLIIVMGESWCQPCLRMTPTIAVFMPEGKPFTPPEDSAIDYILYTYKDSGEHALTIHEGYLTREQLESMIEDLRDA